MKKIINGKMYNTETAKELGGYWNGYSEGDFYFLKETLYLKKSGEYFLHGEGGAASKYWKRFGDGRIGDNVIIPFSEEEAKEWAVEYLSADEYEALFGTVEE